MTDVLSLDERAQVNAELDQMRARHTDLLAAVCLGSARHRRQQMIKDLLVEIARLEGVLFRADRAASR